MPNWCDTTYKCVGDIKEVNALHKVIKDLEKRKTPLVKNGFGKLWLGCVISKLGYDWEKLRCRGEITDYWLEDGILTIFQTTAWCEQEGFREAIECKFPGIKVYYREEEPGCEVYYTNDTAGEYFPEKYVLESYGDYDYFESIEELADFVSKLTGKDIPADEHTIQEQLDQFKEEQDDEDAYFYLHRFECGE